MARRAQWSIEASISVSTVMEPLENGRPKAGRGARCIAPGTLKPSVLIIVGMFADTGEMMWVGGFENGLEGMELDKGEPMRLIFNQSQVVIIRVLSGPVLAYLVAEPAASE